MYLHVKIIIVIGGKSMKSRQVGSGGLIFMPSKRVHMLNQTEERAKNIIPWKLVSLTLTFQPGNKPSLLV